jgi:ketosteroid isomerase-like protein
VIDPQTIADRLEIEALRGEFTDALMMHDYDRLASLSMPDGTVRMPHIRGRGREEIRAAVERLQGLCDFFVQMSHPGTIERYGVWANLHVGTRAPA